MGFYIKTKQENIMHRSLRLAMLPVILAIAGCAASTAPAALTVEPSSIAATPAVAIFGSCPQKPVYPEAAKRENRQGTVVLSFDVDADSSVLETKVTRSSGHADLDEAARVGLAICKFKAATRNGIAVREWARIQYVWTIGPNKS